MQVVRCLAVAPNNEDQRVNALLSKTKKMTAQSLRWTVVTTFEGSDLEQLRRSSDGKVDVCIFIARDVGANHASWSDTAYASFSGIRRLVVSLDSGLFRGSSRLRVGGPGMHSLPLPQRIDDSELEQVLQLLVQLVEGIGPLPTHRALLDALEDAEREVTRLLDLLDRLRRQNTALSRSLGEVEAERNQLQAILDALNHHHGCKDQRSPTVKWLGRAAATTILALGGGAAGGLAQGWVTAPTIVNVAPPETGNDELDAQLVEALKKCLTLIEVADETLPDSL